MLYRIRIVKKHYKQSQKLKDKQRKIFISNIKQLIYKKTSINKQQKHQYNEKNIKNAEFQGKNHAF